MKIPVTYIESTYGIPAVRVNGLMTLTETFWTHWDKA